MNSQPPARKPVHEALDEALAEAMAEERAPQGPARLLIAAAYVEGIDNFIGELADRGHECMWVDTVAEARERLEAEPFELLIVSPALRDGSGFDTPAIAEATPHAAPTCRCIVLSPEPSVEAATRAIQCGAIDYLVMSMTPETFAGRIESAIKKCRDERQRDLRLARLKRICQQLNLARHEITEQIDLLCRDLVNAYQGINAQMNEVAMASEFRTLLRQELDIEDLLRTVLEYMLGKTGPTNAAVFLPDDEGGYSLGAYVNYDCPRETISVVLERLGDAICPQMAEETEIVSFDDADDFAEWIGIEAGMLAESQVLAFTCMHEKRAMAMVVLFRTREKPFGEDLGDIINTLRPIFAEQLATVVRVHNRMVAHWPADAHERDDDDGHEGYDDLDLAA